MLFLATFFFALGRIGLFFFLLLDAATAIIMISSNKTPAPIAIHAQTGKTHNFLVKNSNASNLLAKNSFTIFLTPVY